MLAGLEGDNSGYAFESATEMSYFFAFWLVLV